MRRITTAASLVAIALCFGAPSASAEGPERATPAPEDVPPAALDPRRIPEEIPGAAGSPTQARPQDHYVVQEGDTLARIAEEQLGSPEKWRLLAQANGIDDPRTLRVGQKLTIPPRSS